ncbi:hypothetical protein [Francisella orientalis]|nr:hypothetical protein [Francisella orientalis]
MIIIEDKTLFFIERKKAKNIRRYTMKSPNVNGLEMPEKYLIT